MVAALSLILVEDMTVIVCPPLPDVSVVPPLTPRLPPRPDVDDAGKEEIIQYKDF